MHLTKKPKNYYRNNAILYTVIAVVFFIFGYLSEPFYYYFAIILALVSFYWIRKAWRKK